MLMNHFPTPWAKSAEAATLWQSLRSAPRSLLLLDYDGTLAPFHIDRLQAAPYPGVEDRLATLSALQQVRLALVSGRSARELRDLLRPSIGIEIWGSHGREQLRSDGVYKLFALDPAEQTALEEVGLKMSALGLSKTLEVKPSSLAIHWRGFEPPVQERIRTSVQSIFARLGEPGGLHLLLFDGGLELRTTDRTKRTAVEQILSQERDTAPMAYLGDDLTDEDAFAAIGRRGYSILVRTEARESSARFWLRPPEELLEFLDQWIAATESLPSAAIAAAGATQ
jgi:trehalose-phosphatase